MKNHEGVEIMNDIKFKVERQVNNLLLGYEVLDEEGEWCSIMPSGTKRKGVFSVKHHGALRKRQYSGVNDNKNGTEIFKGDIVKYLDWSADPKVWEVDEIDFVDGSFCLSKNIIDISITVMEVIGDIHSTPELLEKEKSE
ncbi:hypothetical protein KAU43_03665 [candidate division WOR-3 bacterium]|nr:hypothetical protein [candidate division WOR-3 bacterium]